MNLYKGIFDIAGEHLGQRYVTVRSPYLHKHLETWVIDYLERLVTLCNPMDECDARYQIVRGICKESKSQTYRDSM
jgi:hypothetical protein